MSDALVPAAPYSVELPSEEDIVKRLDESVTYWGEVRDPFIARWRKTMAGENEIVLPKARGYRPVARHTFSMRAIYNVKHARYGHMPQFAVMPWGESEDAESDSEGIENWVSSYFEQNARRGENWWGPATEDASQLDEAWVRVDRMPAADWPELVPFEDEKGTKYHEKLYRLFESTPEAYGEARREYKEKAGTPIRCVHVPLENIYPRPTSAPFPLELFELSEVPLYEVLASKLYDQGALDAVMDSAHRDHIDTNTVVNVVRYSNQRCLAYYLLKASSADGRTFYPDAHSMPTTDVTPGGATLLYHTQHDLGRIPYSRITGPYGGWNVKSHPQLTGVGNALLNLQQYLDEMASQLDSNIRANAWKTWVLKLDETKRPIGRGGKRPSPQVNEGGAIELYTDEDIAALPQEVAIEAIQYRMGQLENQMAMLGGSPALYGMHQPGVDTGYQEAQRISQSKSLDEMTEDRLEAGAIDVGQLVLLQSRTLGEELPVTYVAEREDAPGKKFAKTLWLSPEKLTPLPTLDATVTKPAPEDWPSMARVFNDLTTPQGERPAAVTLEWGRENLLGIQQPQQMERALLLQDMKLGALKSGVVGNMVLNELNLLVAESMGPNITEQQMAGSDPAGLMAMQQMMQPGGAATMPGSGGLSPELLAMAQGISGPGRRVGGTPPGSATGESVVGEGIQQREQLGQPMVPA